MRVTGEAITTVVCRLRFKRYSVNKCIVDDEDRGEGTRSGPVRDTGEWDGKRLDGVCNEARSW